MYKALSINLPKNWNIIKFKEAILKVKRGESKRTNNQKKGTLYLTSDYIQDGRIDWGIQKYLITEKDIKPYLLEENDLIINCVNSFAKVGKVALFEGYIEPVIIGFNNFAVKIDSTKIHVKYLVYFFNSKIGYSEIVRIIKPAINQVSFSSKDLNVIEIILPPLEEQQKITKVFSNIDNLIIVSKKRIENLQLIKKGLMQRLFTEGIGHNEFKDTKLGLIPKEWNIKKLIELVKLNPQYSIPNKEDYAYLPMDAIDKEKMSPNYWERRTKEALTTTKFKNGDILFAKITPSTEHGKGALIKNFKEEIGFGSTELVVLSPNEDVFSDYLFYYTKRESFRNRAVSLMEGATGRQRVPTFFFKTQFIAVPKDMEQRQIARFLSNIDYQIINHHYYIDILKHVKKGLMQVLLTGKKQFPEYIN